MYVTVFKWLDEPAAQEWLCEHVRTLIDELCRNSHNAIDRIGLINPPSPEAVVLMRRHLDEDTALGVVDRKSALKPIFDDGGRLIAVECPDHFVWITHIQE